MYCVALFTAVFLFSPCFRICSYLDGSRFRLLSRRYGLGQADAYAESAHPFILCMMLKFILHVLYHSFRRGSEPTEVRDAHVDLDAIRYPM